MSTPPAQRGGTTPPPKTPGWTRALFGSIMSTVKKPYVVESSTHATESTSRSSALRSSNRNMQIHLTSPSEQQGAALSAVDALVAKEPGHSPTSLSPPAMQSVSMASKSPWKSPSKNGGVRFSTGTRTKPAPARKETATKFRKRTKKRYKGSTLLLYPKQRKGPIDPGFAVNALQLSKSVFEPSTRQIEARNNYTSFKPGKRLLGSQQRASRLPPSDALMLVEETSEESHEMPRDKRQKKVCFNESDKPVVTEMTTPVRAELPRKGTPFKSQPVVFMEERSPGLSASPSPKKKFPPLPRLELKVKAPYINFGQEADLEPLGNPGNGDMSELFSLTNRGAKNAKHPSTESKFFDETDSAIAPKPAKKPKDKKSKVDSGGERDNPTKKPKNSSYECADCKTVNDFDNTACTGCGATRKKDPIGWGNIFASAQTMWKCDSCYCSNEEKDTVCPSCEVPRKGHESSAAASSTSASSTSDAIGPSGSNFGASSAPPAASAGAGFSFGGGSSATASGSGAGFTFGSTSTAAAPAPATGSGFTFGGSASAPSGDKASSNTTTTSGFTFGSTKTAPASEEKKESGFKFGATADATSTETDNGDKPKTSFNFNLSGSDKKTEESPKQTFGFGATDSAAAKTPPMKLGLLKQQAPATEPTQKRSRPYSNGDVAKSATKVSESKSFSFPSQATGSADSAQPSFSFGNTKPADSEPTQKLMDKPAFVFGSAPAPSASQIDASASSRPVMPSVPLGSIPGENEDRSKRRRDGNDEKASAGSAPAFGAAPLAPTFTFGNSTPAPAAPSGSLFGSTPALASLPDNAVDPSKASGPATTFGSKPSGDSALSAISFGGAPAPADGFSFGQSSSSTPAFTFGNSSAGDSNAAPAPAFSADSNTASSSSSAAAPMFGGSAPAAVSSTSAAPMFGSTPAQSFGSSTPGQAAPAATNNTFGQSASTPNPFGGAPAPASTPGFSFGSAPTSTPAPPAFGSAPAAQTFGSTPAPTQPPAFGSTPAQPLAFGSTPASTQPPAYGSTPAQPQAFGSTPAQTFGSTPAPGFGNAPHQPPAFGSGAPAPAPSFGGGFGSTPAPPAPGGYGSAPQQQPGSFGGGFGSSATPSAPSMGMNQGAAPSGMGMNQGAAPTFNIGSSGAPKTRRKIRARRPGGSRPA